MAEAKMTIDDMIVALRPVANQAKAALALADVLNNAYDATSVLARLEVEKSRIEAETEKAKRELESWSAKERGAADAYEKASALRKDALGAFNKQYDERVAEIDRAVTAAYAEFQRLKAQEQDALRQAQDGRKAESARLDRELNEKRASMDEVIAAKQKMLDALQKEIDTTRKRLSVLLAG